MMTVQLGMRPKDLPTIFDAGYVVESHPTEHEWILWNKTEKFRARFVEVKKALPCHLRHLDHVLSFIERL